MRRGRPPIAAETAALILLLLRGGRRSNAEIARLAGVAPNTVKRLREGGLRVLCDGRPVELGPGEFVAPQPLRCPGCRGLCEHFPCRLCGACPAPAQIVAQAIAAGSLPATLPARRRKGRAQKLPPRRARRSQRRE